MTPNTTLIHRFGILAAFLLVFSAANGCRKGQADEDAIRAAVQQRLASLGSLNLQAMDLDFTRVTIQNNQATAEVSFRPKTGAPEGAAMQIAYQLEKQDGAWRVVKTSAASGTLGHPAANANPHAQGSAGGVHDGMPNFQDVLGGSSNSGANSAAPSGQSQPSSPAKP